MGGNFNANFDVTSPFMFTYTSTSDEKRVGMTPAILSPSSRYQLTGQLAKSTVGMLSLKFNTATLVKCLIIKFPCNLPKAYESEISLELTSHYVSA